MAGTTIAAGAGGSSCDTTRMGQSGYLQFGGNADVDGYGGGGGGGYFGGGSGGGYDGAGGGGGASYTGSLSNVVFIPGANGSNYSLPGFFTTIPNFGNQVTTSLYPYGEGGGILYYQTQSGRYRTTKPGNSGVVYLNW